jgi:exonuclease III
MYASGYDEKRLDWYGDHKEATDDSGKPNKEKDLGIGVFWKDGITVTQLSEWQTTWSKESNFRYLIPYRVEGNFEPFILIAVWTKNKTDAGDPLDYIQKAHAAVDEYKNAGLINGKVVLIGDFNSNKIWDNLYRSDWNHSALVEKLGKLGIKDCPGGNDTYYYYCNKECHVVDDYCFASTNMAKSITVTVPGPDEWTSENGKKRWNGSDHCPIIVDFKF